MDDQSENGARRRRSKRSKAKVWNKVVWFSKRSGSLKGTHGNVSPLSDEEDYSPAWSTTSPKSYKSYLDSDSSSENEVFEEGYSVRHCKRFPNSEVIEQNCLRPSVAKALFLHLENVHLDRCPKPKYSRRRKNRIDALNRDIVVARCLSEPEEPSAKMACHCIACCSCTPSDRLNGVCPAFRRKCVSTSSLDRGLEEFESAQSCDRTADLLIDETKQSATFPKVTKTAQNEQNQPYIYALSNTKKHRESRCQLCKPNTDVTDLTNGSRISKNQKHTFTIENNSFNEIFQPGTYEKPDLHCDHLIDEGAVCNYASSEKVQDEYSLLKCTPDQKTTSITPDKTSPSGFKNKSDAIEKWFCAFSNEQKNVILQRLLSHCDVPQTHLLCEQLGAYPHPGCPANCQDRIQWLPHVLVLHIFSFLDPVSLSRASMVCKAWSELANEPSLWRKFCSQPKWRLSRTGEQKQIIQHMAPNTAGTVHWKRVFSERYRLHNNWMRGRCTVRTFEGHTQGVSCVQFDDTRIVSGSSDKTIKVWNIRTNSPWSVQTLVGHSGTVRCLHLDGNRLVSGSTDTTIKVWDLSTQHTWSSIACKGTMTGHLDTVRCLQVDDEKVISGSYDQTLKIWNIRTGRCLKTLRGHEAAVLCVRFDSSKIVTGSCDKTIKVWSFEGTCVRTLEGHQDAVTCLQFDTQRIVSGSLDCTLRFWDIRTGQCSNTIDWKASEGHTGVVRCLQADSWRVVSASDDRTLKVWSLETGKRLVTLRNHEDGVTCLQFNDSIIVSGSYDKTVKLWDFSSV